MEDPIYLFISTTVSTASKGEVDEPSPSDEREGRVYAIGGGIDVFAGEEVRTNKGEERVVFWKIPDFEDESFVCDFSVANSRISKIGFHDGGDSSIVKHLSFKKKDPSWVKVKIDGGFVSSSRGYPCYGRCFLIGDRIAQMGFGGQLVRFRTPRHDLDADLDPEYISMKPPKELFDAYFPGVANPELYYPMCCYVVGVTKDNRLLMFWGCNSTCHGGLGYYDMEININPTCWQWHTIDADFTWPSGSSNSPVFVRDKYMILFHSNERIPGCYVYDTSTRKWLVKPIQGLSYPDIPCEGWVVECGIGMALVWMTPNFEGGFEGYDVHWVKFKLVIDEETDPPTLSAETLSSDSLLSHSGGIIGGVLTSPLSSSKSQSSPICYRSESEVSLLQLLRSVCSLSEQCSGEGIVDLILKGITPGPHGNYINR